MKSAALMQHPLVWKGVNLVELYKGKGALTDQAAYRDIALCSVPGKAVSRMVRRRAAQVMHEAALETMFGSGLNGGGTDFGHLYVRACADVAEVRGKSFVALFLDAVAAFAMVCRAVVLPVPETEATLGRRLREAGLRDEEIAQTLADLQFYVDHGDKAWEKQGCSDHLRLAMAALMTNTWASFDGSDRVVRTSTGTMAGSPLSDLLFSLLMVRLLLSLRAELKAEGLVPSMERTRKTCMLTGVPWPSNMLELFEASLVDDVAIPLVGKAGEM